MAATLKKNARKPDSRPRNPDLRYCIHDRSERQQCAKCNAFNEDPKNRCEYCGIRCGGSCAEIGL